MEEFRDLTKWYEECMKHHNAMVKAKQDLGKWYTPFGEYIFAKGKLGEVRFVEYLGLPVKENVDFRVYYGGDNKIDVYTHWGTVDVKGATWYGRVPQPLLLPAIEEALVAERYVLSAVDLNDVNKTAYVALVGWISREEILEDPFRWHGYHDGQDAHFFECDLWTNTKNRWITYPELLHPMDTFTV